MEKWQRHLYRIDICIEQRIVYEKVKKILMSSFSIIRTTCLFVGDGFYVTIAGFVDFEENI